MHSPIHLALPTVLKACAVTAAAATVPAQEVIYELQPTEFGFRFGHAVHALADVDGDGAVDFAAGHQVGFTGFDRVEVFSGATGAKLWGASGPDSLHRYGSALAQLDDLDGDGVPELAIGASQSSQVGHRGYVEVRSGASGAWLATWTGPLDTNFAETLATAGDFDGDGRRELLVGASFNFHQGGGDSAVHVLSGADGSTLHRIAGVGFDELGKSLVGLPDVDGDGIDDLAAGGSNFVRVFSGATGARLSEVSGHSPGGSFGAAIAPWIDLDGDEVIDLAVSTPIDTDMDQNPIGHVDVVSSATGVILATLRPERSFGAFGVSLTVVGDLDYDGVSDLAVGQQGLYLFGAGSAVHVYSGADRGLLFTRPAMVNFEEFGHAIAPLGDVDGDGFFDLVAGAPGTQTVRVLTYRTLVGESYCRANPNSTGEAAKIFVLGSDRLADERFTLLAAPVPARKAGLFFYGADRQELPFGPGYLCIASKGGGLRRLPVAFSFESGVLALPVDATARFKGGESWNFQAFFRDPQGRTSFHLSNAVGVSFRR